MLKRFFITGTDTSVGKTVVSRALLQALASGGKSVAGYKPVAKGSKETPEGLRNKDALVLQSVSSIELPYEAINPIALSEEWSGQLHSVIQRSRKPQRKSRSCCRGRYRRLAQSDERSASVIGVGGAGTTAGADGSGYPGRLY